MTMLGQAGRLQMRTGVSPVQPLLRKSLARGLAVHVWERQTSTGLPPSACFSMPALRGRIGAAPPRMRAH